jgi:hypothetical protein
VATESALTQLFRQIALADDYVSSWVPLMDIAPVGRNPVGECAKFLLISSLCALISSLIGFQIPSARSCNSDKTSDYCATLQCRAIHEGIRVSEFIICMKDQ